MSKENEIKIGRSGDGQKYTYWKGLKRCSCGKYPYVIGKDKKTHQSGPPYKVICIYCHKSSNVYDTIKEAISMWNFAIE